MGESSDFITPSDPMTGALRNKRGILQNVAEMHTEFLSYPSTGPTSGWCEHALKVPCSREPTRPHANFQDERYNAHEMLSSSPVPPFFYPDQAMSCFKRESHAAAAMTMHLANCRADAQQQVIFYACKIW